MESSGPGGGIDYKRVAAIFKSVHQGYSADRVIADPAMNASFIDACAEAGIRASTCGLNRALLNLRKSGGLLCKTTRFTSFDDDNYRFGSEIAIRVLERRDGVSVDDVLCDPSRAVEFDQLAASIAPGYSPIEYRWAALTLRKERSLPPEIAARMLRPEAVYLARMDGLDLSTIPCQPGVYAFLDTDSKQTLYVGEATSLRSRLGTHVDHSDNKLLARHFWDHGIVHITVEYYVLPVGTSKRELRAIELEQIQQRNPPFNISGRA